MIRNDWTPSSVLGRGGGAWGCQGALSSPPPCPAVSQARPGPPLKSSRPSSGRGRDYSGLSRVDSSGTEADERNAPPRAGPAAFVGSVTAAASRLPSLTLCAAPARPLGHGLRLSSSPATRPLFWPSPGLSFPVCSMGMLAQPPARSLEGYMGDTWAQLSLAVSVFPGAWARRLTRLHPGNARWQGERIHSRPEWSRGKCC